MKGKSGYSIGPVRGLQNLFVTAMLCGCRLEGCGGSAGGSSVVLQRGDLTAQALDFPFLALQDVPQIGFRLGNGWRRGVRFGRLCTQRGQEFEAKAVSRTIADDG